MPLVRPGYLSEVPVTTFGFGRSDTVPIQRAFVSSPFFDDFNDANVRLSFTNPRELAGDGFTAILSDGGYMFGSVPRYYPNAPNLT